jgi:multiple sugar transport system permease protein
MRRPRSWQRGLAWAVLGVLVVVTLFPFYWVLRIALSDNSSLASNAGSFLPSDITLGAFKRVLGLASPAEIAAQGGSGASIHFWRYLFNSVFTSTIITVGQVLFSAAAAYAFSRLRWIGRDKVFLLFLTALMIPPIFIALPNFVTIKNLGLLNTYAGIVAPFVLMSPFALFFLRQFFLGLSREVEEAAKIDGAGHLRIFFGIVLPANAAPVATLALLVYITAWNEYLWPLLVGADEKVRVLTVALGIFQSQTPQGGPDWSGLMAATLLAASPIVVLFLAFGRRIVNSIQFTGFR